MGGKSSDKYIVENSGYLKHLLPGNVVLADRGFDVADSVALYGATLDIPVFTRGCNQLGPREVEATRKLANVRIHVETVISAMRQRFQILSATGVLQKEMYSRKLNDGVVFDAVVKIGCSLHKASGTIQLNINHCDSDHHTQNFIHCSHNCIHPYTLAWV